MTRYWVSWWSGCYESERYTDPPFQYWISGYRARPRGRREDASICAVIDAPSEAAIWASVERHFPDYEQRFCSAAKDDYQPGDRFPGFQNRTSLDEPPEQKRPPTKAKAYTLRLTDRQLTALVEMMADEDIDELDEDEVGESLQPLRQLWRKVRQLEVGRRAAQQEAQG